MCMLLLPASAHNAMLLQPARAHCTMSCYSQLGPMAATATASEDLWLKLLQPANFLKAEIGKMQSVQLS